MALADGERSYERPSPWVASGALFVALSAAMGAFHVAFEGSVWWLMCVVVSAAVLGASGLARMLSSRFARTARPGAPARQTPSILSLAPTIVGALVGFAIIVLTAAPATTFAGLPTSATWDALWLLYATGSESLSAQVPPAEVDGAVLALVISGVAAMAVLLDAVAISLRRPAIAGLILLVVTIVPSVVVRSAEFGWLLLTGFAWLGMLAADRPFRGRRAWDAIAVGACAAVVALLAPVFVPVPSSGATAGPNGGEIRMGVNPIVGLGEDLRRPAERPALEYSTTSGTPRYLRLMALEGLDDSGWFHVPTPGDALDTGVAPSPDGLSDEVSRFVESTTVSIRELGGLWVPMPYPAVGVDEFRAAATWDVDTIALRTDRRSIRGEDFTVASLSLDPTPQQLQDVGLSVPGEYLALAQADPEWPSVISETALSVTADSSTNYERALALQDFLRNGNFLYSEKAPVREGYDGTSADVVGVFLTERAGYCVHFASAMAMMARSLGIPARVAVGFLPGEKSDETSFPEGETAWLVTSKDLHAWPELFFDGIGWIPFEPTTGRGTVPDYAEPEALDDVAPANPTAAPETTPRPSAAPNAPVPLADEPRPGTGQAGATDAALSPWLLALPVLLVLALVPAVARSIQRSSKLSAVRRRRGRAALAWDEVIQTARDLDLPVDLAATPRSNAAVLSAHIDPHPNVHPGGSVTGSTTVLGTVPAVDQLLAAVEREQFSRDDTPDSGAAAVAASVIRQMRRSLPLGRRVIAVLWPRSVIERIIRTIS